MKKKTKNVPLRVKKQPTRNQLCPCGVKVKNCEKHKRFLNPNYYA